jgi:hypothetical protein
MTHSTSADRDPNSTSTLPEQPGVLVVRKHHFLVRWSHWLNVPLLLGLILSGISIYWASPIYQHKPDPNTGNVDVAAPSTGIEPKQEMAELPEAGPEDASPSVPMAIEKPEAVLYVARPGDRPPSTDAARHTLQRSAPYRGSWSTAPSVGARETWFEECEGHYQDYVCRGRAKRLLGRTWIFPLRRNLTPFKLSRSQFWPREDAGRFPDYFRIANRSEASNPISRIGKDCSKLLGMKTILKLPALSQIDL